MNTEINRVYHAYTSWEDYFYGMYKTTCFMDSTQMVVDAEMTLRCPELLWSCMNFVSHNWCKAAEHHLTNFHRNRQAWLGQAACCMLNGTPEYITKIAWGNLNQEQQKIANDIADNVLADWDDKYRKGYFEWQKPNLERMS